LIQHPQISHADSTYNELTQSIVFFCVNETLVGIRPRLN